MKKSFLRLSSLIIITLILAGCSRNPEIPTTDPSVSEPSLPTISEPSQVDAPPATVAALVPTTTAPPATTVPTTSESEPSEPRANLLPSTFIIEIEAGRGERFSLSSTDLYYRFYYNAQKSTVLAKSWAEPSAINANYLVNFFVAQSNWNQTANDAVTVYLPQETVKEYIKMYFDVETAQIRSAGAYQPEQKAYELPLYPWEYPSTITKATAEGNILTLFYETYSYFDETHPVLRQGQVTIEIELFPHRFHYLSNRITFDSDK